MINRPIKFQISISIHYADMKCNAKCRNGVVWGC